MGQAWSLEEILSNVAADLICLKRYEPFLRLLFASPRGEWLAVKDYCRELPTLPDLAEEVIAEHAEHLVATHLAWPGEPKGDRYASVIFTHSDQLWSFIALYDRSTLDTA